MGKHPQGCGGTGVVSDWAGGQVSIQALLPPVLAVLMTARRSLWSLVCSINPRVVCSTATSQGLGAPLCVLSLAQS